jgi:hypothetical protein
MVERHISMRGEVVDFNRLRLANPTTPALGNASMNARGDILGQNGTILKTQEQVDAEWAAMVAAQQAPAPVDLKDHAAMSAAGGPAIPRQPQKQLDVDDADFDPDAAAKPRRKIIESDE